jgi:hypothetical protein
MWRAVRSLVGQWGELRAATARVEELASAVSTRPPRAGVDVPGSSAASARSAAADVARGAEEGAPQGRMSLVERLRAARDHEANQIRFIEEHSKELLEEQEAEVARAVRSVNDKLSIVRDEQEAARAAFEQRAQGVRGPAGGGGAAAEAKLRETFGSLDGVALARALQARGTDIEKVRASLVRRMGGHGGDAPSAEELESSRRDYEVLLEAIREVSSPQQRQALADAVGATAGTGTGARRRISDLLDGKSSVEEMLGGRR